MSKPIFRVIQFTKDWNGHREGDRAPMRDWLADELVRQQVAKRVVLEIKSPELQYSAGESSLIAPRVTFPQSARRPTLADLD